MALVIKTIAKTALGNIKGNVEMYNGGNIDEILGDLATQIDAKLSSAMHYKGSVNTYADLPKTPEEGDVYNVKATGKNYAWDGTEWDELSGVMDLTAYLTDEQNEAKYLQIANFATVAETNGYSTKTYAEGKIAEAIAALGDLASKDEVAKSDLAAALAAELDAKATTAALNAVDAKFANYTLTADLGALATKDTVGYSDFTAELKTAFDAKAENTALQALAATVADNTTAIGQNATAIAANTAKFANYTETEDLGVLALLDADAAKAQLDAWGYGKSADVSALAAKMTGIGNVTLAEKATITSYELWEAVSAIITAAKGSAA